MKTPHLKALFLTLLGLTLTFASPLYADDHDEDYDEEEEYEELREEINYFLTKEPEGIATMKFIDGSLPPEIKAFLKAAVNRDPELAEGIIEHVNEVREEHGFLLEEAPDEASLFLQIQKHELMSIVHAESFDPESRYAQEIEAKIRKEVETAFDLKMRMEKQEIEMLEDEIETLRRLINEREKSRDLIIQRRIDELTGANEHLEW